MSFEKGFEKTAKDFLTENQKDYALKVMLPAGLAFGLHGAAFANKGTRMKRFLESATRGLITGTIIGGAAHLKKKLEKGS